MRKPSNAKIILMGQLMVNIPVAICILGVATVGVLCKFGVMLSTLIGSAAGWFVWNKLLDLWIDWAVRNNVPRRSLYKLGKIGFINRFRNRIFKENEN